jgi:hypothetical protein
MSTYAAAPPSADRPSDRKPSIEYLGRKGQGAMDEEEFAAVIRDAVQQSVQFVDNELSIERARATEYYLGKPFGNEEEGRSQVVLTEVRDAVDGMLPSILRVFFGAEHAVEFVPTRADNVAQAEQKTDYVRYVFEEDNDGFLEALSVLKDGLIRKIGIFKWWWDTSETTRAYRMEGVTQDELKMLAADDDVTITHTVKRKPSKQQTAEFEQAKAMYAQQLQAMKGQPQNGQAPPPPQMPVLYDVDLTRKVSGGRVAIQAVPPEEFIFNRQARSIRTALLVGHRTYKTRGELIAMGISEEDIENHASASGAAMDAALSANAEEIARRDVAGVGRVLGFGFTNDPEMGKANDKIAYGEFDVTVDFDGDGTAELRHVCTIGPVFYPVINYPTDERRFAIFGPYPEPHTLLAGSVADRTMDVQKINSALMRGTLDSLSISLFPRPIYQEGQASVADIMNTAIGAPIRERLAGAVRWSDVPFAGEKVLPVLNFMQEVIERRTGRNKGAAGLDADALQSTGKEAVGAVLTGSQEQLEMICRIFAQMTLKPLFKGVGRLLQEKQPRERMVRLRGQWVEIDPRTWTADMDVTVNVGLGTTFTDKKVATLVAVAQDQQTLLQTLGLDNPIVSLGQFRATRAKILSLQGIKDADSYYKPIPLDWQPPPTPPQPDPNAAAMQAEKEMNQIKTMKELAIKQDEMELKKAEFSWQQEYDMRKLAADIEIKKYQADAQFHSTMTQAAFDANLAQETKETELTMQAHDQLHDQQLEKDGQAHDQQMAERAADTADQQASMSESE